MTGTLARVTNQYARKRLEAIADFSVPAVNKEIEALAQDYFAALDIPEKAKIDAFHLAVAAWASNGLRAFMEL
ncbi:MAG: hypothetical protein ACRD8U_25555 [Pyrinomonadaceae bacterium]